MTVNGDKFKQFQSEMLQLKNVKTTEKYILN